MEKVTFDGTEKLIIVNEDEDEVSVKADIYSAWKRWVTLSDNAKYVPALRTIGGDPIGNNLFSGDLYFLINGWKISIPASLVRIEGAIFNDEDEPPFIISPGGGVISTVSQLVQTVGGTSGGEINLSQQDIRDSLTFASTRDADIGSIDNYLSDLQQTSSDTGDKLDTVDTKVSNIAPVINDIQLNINNLTLDLEQTQTLVDTLIKYQSNRTKVDPIARTLTIYNDDGITPIKTFDLLDSSGNATTDYIFERVPK